MPNIVEIQVRIIFLSSSSKLMLSYPVSMVRPMYTNTSVTLPVRSERHTIKKATRNGLKIGYE